MISWLFKPWWLRSRYLEYLPRAHAALSDPVAEVKRLLHRFMQSLSAPG